MPIVDSSSHKIVREFSIAELEQAALLMRGYDLVALCAAGSGHSGGTLSVMEIVAALYLKIANHDPNKPDWSGRDRVIWSAGHKAPALYLGLGFSGYFPIEDIMTLRKLYSPFQGHPHRVKLPGVEVSSGSLGQGLSIAVGMALAGKLDHDDHTVFCIMGDGEQQEGNIWEAVMEASHYKLDNLVGIIDRNRLQIDGWVKDVMNVEPLEERYRSFGWEVLVINGHDIPQVVDALQIAKSVPVAGRPTVIIANTVKGKGVSFMENVAGWHGKAPSYDEMVKALGELGLKEVIAYDALLNQAKEYQKEVGTYQGI
jgi:transketolase